MTERAVSQDSESCKSAAVEHEEECCIYHSELDSMYNVDVVAVLNGGLVAILYDYGDERYTMSPTSM
jgi:hypothetical protein